MRDLGEYVLVEGDILLSKAMLVSSKRARAAGPLRPTPNRAGPPAPRSQWSTDQIVSGGYVRSVTVDLSGLASEPNWAAASRRAIVDWNGANADVHLTEASPGDIQFVVTPSLRSGAIAEATFPADATTYGKPGPRVTISQAYDGLAGGQMEYNVVHELGHTLGLRHTNWQGREASSPYGANLIAGTPQTDPYSVMNANSGSTYWSGFSQYDLVAIQTLYPRFAASIFGPNLIKRPGVYTYRADLSGGSATSYYYTWKVAYCYAQPCSYSYYSTFAEGVGVSSVSMNFDAADVERDIWVYVREYSGGFGRTAQAETWADGPSF